MAHRGSRRYCSKRCSASTAKRLGHTPNPIHDFGDHLGLELVDGKGRVVGMALVDKEDYERIKAFRWGLTHSGKQPSVTSTRNKVPRSRTVLLHRVVLDAPSGLHVDHINHNRLDNRRCNLRLATPAQNSANRLPVEGRSLPTGVYFVHDERCHAAGCRNRGRVTEFFT